MFKFIHAADIHLDSPLRGIEGYEDAPVGELRQATRRAFDNLIDLAVEEQVAFLLICGDLYDGDWKDYHTGLFFIDRMARLRKENIDVFLVSGNHDAASQITRTLKLPENVHLFSGKSPQTITLDHLNVAVHGQSYATRVITENLAKAFPPGLPHHFNIGMLHTSLNGRQGHEPYAPCTTEDLCSKGYDYWALGHVHMREQVSSDPWIVFSGNIQARHIKETGEKGATLVTVEDDAILSVDHHQLDVVRWHFCRIDISDCQSLDMLNDQIRDELLDLRNKPFDGTLAVRIELIGRSRIHSRIFNSPEHLTENIRGITAGIEGIWLEKVVLATQRDLPTDQLLDSQSPLSGLITMIDNLSVNLSEFISQTPEIEALKTRLPIEMIQEDLFLSNDPETIRILCQQVKEMLIARMIGHEEDQ